MHSPARRHRPRLRIILAALTALAGATLLAEPAGARGVGIMPSYTIKAVQFRAIDETGTDWLGADETYIGSIDHTRSVGWPAITKIWEGTDTGDVRQIPATQQCLSRTNLTVDNDSDGRAEGYKGDEWTCGSTPSIDVEIDVWEKEGNYDYWNFEPNCLGCTRLNSDDEHVGRARIAYSAAELRLILDERGEAFAWDQHFADSGHYAVTLVVTRVT